MSRIETPVFAEPRIVAEEIADGALQLRSIEPLGEFQSTLVDVFRQRAESHPARLLAAERATAGGWRTVTWGEARVAADSLAQSFLDRGLGPQRPLMILSGNSIAHLLSMLGAMTAGGPVLPISTAYSVLSSDHARIRSITKRCRPGMVFAEDGEAFGPALRALDGLVPEVVVCAGGPPEAVLLKDLMTARPGADVEAARAAIRLDSVAKILFTSGSTGAPKGVITTHRMLSSNQQALGQIWPFLHDEPPVLVDWLPWSHTFGGNHNLGQVIAFGGSLYIDDSRPEPRSFERTIEALRAVPPTIYYNVPAGYALLTPRLEEDREFAGVFFSRLRFMFYAAAALPDDLWRRLHAIKREVTDRPIPLTASWGTTETAPAATSAHFDSARSGCIGVPIPGVTLKLAPAGSNYELRVKGPNVTPGYYDDPAATAAAFDEDGFYRSGDAVRLVDEDDVSQGLMFEGRLSEDFKLTTGTWVHVGALRSALVSECGGILRDAVIAGSNRAYVTALAWVDAAQAQRACGGPSDALYDAARVRGMLAAALARLNEGVGSASRIRRMLLMDEPPQMDAGEITDKGYINQRAVLERRASAVDTVFAEPAPPNVIVPALPE